VTPPARILILKLGAIGDVIHALPVARTLRTSFPQAHLAWAIEERAFDVLSGNPDLNDILVFRRGAALGHLWAWAAELRAQRFSVVIDLHNLLKTGLMARAACAPRRIGFDKWREGNFLFMTETVRPGPDCPHLVEKYLALLAPLGIGRADWRLEFPFSWSAPDAERIDRYLRQHALDVPGGPVALNPGAAWPSKRWPPERFARVADELQDRFDVPIVVLWGPGERELAEAVVRAMTRHGVLAPETTLKSLGALLARCRLLVTGDTGPLHLAAALDRPTVALFGPSDPRRNGAFSARSRVVCSPVPPATHWQRKERGARWMEALPVEWVVDAAAQQLKSA
jgi:lipopolysaccharide heptosyltransferase II